ncbi:Insecticidal toxin complex protein [Tamlana sp. s12]|uniref:Insecticidal toxin complex protein n=1 Tax=Tamlana sp. s12 TaxID=1630406 RepID=UPI000800DC72|nr:Insecticidal toxin complex protein [Tamlana sp. s12]OBQ55341.1 Insecticidal toxin complex protein [Tamlana sp. s12]QQY80983.1 Insecticidal toxin complex protein [Tamlana sp. s12]
MRLLLLVCFICFSTLGHAKEWKSLRAYEKETGQRQLKASDWLKSDRKQNTTAWQNANVYNLKHNRPLEYETIKQRRDFYVWYNTTMKTRDCQVVWPKMAHFVSIKLQLIYTFPFCLFTTKNIKTFAYQGSETVFVHAFEPMKALYENNSVLLDEGALKWDEAVVYKEQYIWLEEVYSNIDERSLKTIERIAKGKGFYKILVPKAIRFTNDIDVTQNRYDYALNVLRDYCKNHYK